MHCYFICCFILFAVAAYILNFTSIINNENIDIKPKVFAYIDIRMVKHQ